MADSRKSKIENVDIIDPLGEIRRRAKELWRNAGEPQDKTWEDFFQSAEDDLLGGRSAGGTTARKRDDAPRGLKGLHQESLTPNVIPLVEQSENILLSVVANSVKSLLNEHDSLCLARVLATHLIQLRTGEIFERLPNDVIAGLLAQLSLEYDSDFLKKHGVSDGRTVSLLSRTTYWQDRITFLERSDSPLSYTDRNTIARLRVAIAAEARVLEVTFKDN